MVWRCHAIFPFYSYTSYFLSLCGGLVMWMVFAGVQQQANHLCAVIGSPLLHLPCDELHHPATEKERYMVMVHEMFGSERCIAIYTTGIFGGCIELISCMAFLGPLSKFRDSSKKISNDIYTHAAFPCIYMLI
jgi:hypothetical protein